MGSDRPAPRGAATAYLRPWDLALHENRRQLNARVPENITERLEGLRDWILAQAVDELPEHLADTNAIGDLVALACHQLCRAAELEHNHGRPFTPRRAGRRRS